MIPLVDLQAHHRRIRPELDDAIGRVLDSGRFVLGDEVAAFEDEFAAYCGARYGVGVNSGTSALQLALLAAGVKPGDEVVTVPFTFVATVAAILYTGARPVFVDIEPRTCTMDVAQVERALGPRTKAIVPVHLYGQAADLASILDLAERRGLAVIEDAAQAHGAEYRGCRVGGLGDLGCFSFYPGKNLGACGEAGMVVTNNQEHARIVRLLRDWGQRQKYEHVLPGFNYRMDAIQGAILRVKLRHLEAWTEARRRHAALYDRLFAESDVQIPAPGRDGRHVYHVYAVRVPQRDGLRTALLNHGIETGVHYPRPVHLQEAYAGLGYRAGDFPHAEAAAEEVLSLPIYPELSQEQIEFIASAVREAVGVGSV